MADPIDVPLLDLRAQYAGIRDEIREAIDRVLESQRFILGPEVDAFEAEVAAYCESAFAVGCTSGSDAVLLALMALDINPGDEVLCPSYTFFATAGSISRLGARPVFADVDPVTYNLDPIAARKAAAGRRRLRALLPVHLFGQMADMEALLALGRELGVPVIEDAAQAIGARDLQSRRAGSSGALGCLSFFPSKNLGAYGDAGLVLTGDPELAERLRVLRVHGGQPKYFHSVVGINGRIDALQAAILRVKLRHLDRWHEGRRANAARYDRAFAALGAEDSGIPLREGGFPVRTPRPAPAPAVHIYNQYVIRVPAERRDGLRQHLSGRGIGTEIYYPLGLHEQECFRDLGYLPGDLPETEAAGRETLALPIYPELSPEQQDRVVAAVAEFLD